MAIGIGWPNASAGVSYVKKLIKTFKERVLSYPNSIFEAEPCLDATLTELNAIGLLKQASLIITPNAYNEGKLYDVVPNTTLGDMDVVRATTATRVNSAGLIEVVPRNLLTYSEQFNNTDWYKNNVTVTANSIISPSGTLTADTITIPSAGYGIFQVVNVSPSSTYTFSFYAKKGTNTSYILDVIDGTTFTSFTTIDYSSQLNSNWVRVSATFTTASTTTSVRAYLIRDGSSVGNGYFWGAQVEASSTATEYFPTTTRLNIPRIDYTNGSCPSLLVEPQRTNLLTYSEQFNNAAWTNVRGQITANSTISPDGTTNADTFASATGQAFFPVLTRTPIFAGNTSYSLSIFAKVLGNTNIFNLGYVDNIIGYTGGGASFNLATQVITINQSPNSSVTASMQNYGNGWYRLTLKFLTIVTPTFNYLEFGISTNDVANGFALYGAQLELGSYATSYIPTVATSVTRNADLISKTGISSLIGQTEGTIFWEGYLDGSANSGQLVGVGKSGFDVIRIQKEGLLVLSVQVYNNGFAFIKTFPFVSGYNKIAFVYKSGNSFCYLNGIKVVTDASTFAFTGVADEIDINNLWQSNSDITMQSINSIQLYKTALTDAECLQLTTL